MKDAGRWQRIEDLFAHAIELPTGPRLSYLAAECGEDAELRAEVESLVGSVPGAGARLRAAVGAGAASLTEEAAASRVGQRIGPYRVVSVIGEGGMGTVYLAERDDAQYRRKVAIKVLQHGLASPQIIARFRDERQILASLEHPAIVRLLDGGTTEDGLPYVVMEHIDGVPLATYARGRSVRERVELVRRVCDALEYAHQQLVVHRDIKPSNIMVATDGTPKLLDFGIAKLLEPSAAQSGEARTRTGVALLTPEYASPEQARGGPITVATDVYSLGAVLYDLLVGGPPQRPTDNLLDTLRAICEVDPPRPSTAGPPTDRRALAGDLDNIVLKAMHKDPSRRYRSVAALAGDLDRYLGGRPVLARDATLAYRTGKFVARNRGAVTMATLVAAALATATVVSIFQARRARESEAEARRQSRALLAEQGRRELLDGQAGRALPYLIAAWRAGEDTPALRFLVAEAKRPFMREIASILDLDAGVNGVAWFPDGSRFVAIGFEGRARIYDRDGAPLLTLDVPGDAQLMTPTIGGGGAFLAAGSTDGVARVWQLAGGASPRVFAVHNGNVSIVAGDAHLASCGEDGRSVVWDVAAGVRMADIRTPPPLEGCALSPDGRRLITASPGGILVEWDARTGARVTELPRHDGDARIVRFSPDGARFYVEGGQRASIWDARRRQPIATLPPHPIRLNHMDLSPDGRWMVTAGDAGTVRIWDAISGEHRVDVLGHTAAVVKARFSADGTRLVTISEDNTFRVCDAATGALEVDLVTVPVPGSAPHSPAVAMDPRFSPDGSRILSVNGAEVLLWRAGREPLALDIDTGALIRGGAISADGTLVAAVGKSGHAGVWSLTNGERVATLATTGDLVEASFGRDGRSVAIVGDGGYAEVVVLPGGLKHPLEGHRGSINCVRHRPDGGRLVTCGDDRTARIWDAATGAPLLRLVHPDRVMAAAWSRDGSRLVTAGWDGKLRTWDGATGALLAEVSAAGTQFLSVAFTPDERGVLAGTHEGAVAVWDLASGARRQFFEGHTGPVTSSSYSADGELVATTSTDRTARIWDAGTGALLATRQNADVVMQGHWDGAARFVTFGGQGHVRVWDARREPDSVDESAAFAERRVPWRLDRGRLERALRQ